MSVGLGFMVQAIWDIMQRHILGAVKKSKLCGTAPDYKGKMCGKVR